MKKYRKIFVVFSLLLLTFLSFVFINSNKVFETEEMRFT